MRRARRLRSGRVTSTRRRAQPVSEYPEHDKMQAIKPAADAIGEFIEWLDTTNYVLAYFDGSQYVHATGRDLITRLLAQHFNIDLSLIDAEKQQMIDYIRAANQVAAQPTQRCSECFQLTYHKMDCSRGR